MSSVMLVILAWLAECDKLVCWRSVSFVKVDKSSLITQPGQFWLKSCDFHEKKLIMVEETIHLLPKWEFTKEFFFGWVQNRAGFQ